MSNGEEKNLTPEEIEGIILTDDEERFIRNFRIQAKRNPHAKLAVIIQTHDGELQYGTLCLDVAPHCSQIRL